MNVIFDLDGTLIDSAPDIRAAVNRVLEGEGQPPLDLATITSFVGNGLPKLMERVIAHLGLPPKDHARLTATAHAAYLAAPAACTTVYPGVPQALAALQGAGRRLGLCTNKPEGPARAILDQLGLMPFFAAVVGGGRLPVLKPDPAMFHLCARELGGGPAIFVGDSEVDAATARAAAAPFALFTEGYRKVPLQDMPHDAAFSDFARLPGVIAALAG